MKTICVLVVDDEPQSRALVCKLLSELIPQVLIEEAESVSSAIEKIKLHNPRLVFLDVQMKGESGFDLLDKLNNINFDVIFTTAHSEFALKAFRYSAMDYLIKPLDREEFNTAVEKAIKKINDNHISAHEQIDYFKQIRTEQKIPDKLIIPSIEGYLFINFHEILYCFAVSNYTEFHLSGNKKILSSYTLGYYDELLKDHGFFRIHRSYLINLSHIKMYRRGDGGAVIMENDEEIEVSRNKKESFLKILKS